MKMNRISNLKAIRSYLRTCGKCYCCGVDLTLDPDNSVTMATFSNTERGVVVLCASCSRRKKALSLDDYRLVYGKKFYGETLKYLQEIKK